MADEQLVPGTGEDRVDSKRKCEDFAALYTLDTTHSSVAVSRGINDHTGKSSTSSQPRKTPIIILNFNAIP